MEAAVAVRGLVRAYGGRQVLAGLDFDVARGEIFGLLGRNGAGKTTTVEILQGLRRRDGGDVLVLGRDPARESARLRSLVGSQLQSSALPDRIRVGEAVRLFCRLAGDVVEPGQLLEEWDLHRLSRSAFGDLSGGERQRLFLALALVNRPQIVFLDELTQGLDPVAKRATWALVRDVRDAGATVVLVSHDMDEVGRLCDRVAILHDGHLLAVDPPGALVARVGGQVETTFSSPLNGLATLRDLPGVDDVTVDAGRVRVAGDTSSPVHVAAALRDHQVFPADLQIHRPTLDDVFLSMTGPAS